MTGRCQALASRPQNVAFETTVPGKDEIKSLQACLYAVLNGANTVLLHANSQCDVRAGNSVICYCSGWLRKNLQCFDAVGWAAGRASGL